VKNTNSGGGIYQAGKKDGWSLLVHHQGIEVNTDSSYNMNERC
jgi:hypothetical protein